MFTYITDVGVSYGQTANMDGLEPVRREMLSYTNESQQLSTKLNRITNATLSSDSFFDIPYTLIQVSWDSLKMMAKSVFGVITIVETLINYLSITLHIPAIVADTIVAILFITVISMLVYMFFKWKAED